MCDANWLQTHKTPKVNIDRHKSSTYKASLQQAQATGSVNKAHRTVFGQLFTQVRSKPPKELRNKERAYYVSFVGEHADDYGGPYREVLSMASDELMSTILPLFVLCPNGRDNVGQNMDRYVPNPSATDATSLAMFEFLGQLMGVAIRTKCPLELSLPSLVWKPLVGHAVEFGDVEDVHESARLFVSRLKGMMTNPDLTPENWPRVVEKIGLTYSTVGFAGTTVDLFASGSDVPVSWEGRQEYLRLLKAHRVSECAIQVAAIARGLATQVPRHLLSLFTWQELELMVCGRTTVDLALLKSCTVYGERVSASDLTIRYFWSALESFSEAERVMYLRFVWGRSRLPLTAAGFTRKHKISYLLKDRPDSYLPVAHTCFLSLDLPRYSSKTVLREKLLYAITHCQAIDADDTTAARQSARQIGRSAWRDGFESD